VHKFQAEAGGKLSGGTPGIRLIEAAGDAKVSNATDLAENESPEDGHFRLLPLYRIFGSEELSARSPAIAQLVRQAWLQINPVDAQRLETANGDSVVALIDNEELNLEIEINSSIPRGCAGFVCGLPGSSWLLPESTTNLTKTAEKPLLQDGDANV